MSMIQSGKDEQHKYCVTQFYFNHFFYLQIRKIQQTIITLNVN